MNKCLQQKKNIQFKAKKKGFAQTKCENHVLHRIAKKQQRHNFQFGNCKPTIPHFMKWNNTIH